MDGWMKLLSRRVWLSVSGSVCMQDSLPSPPFRSNISPIPVVGLCDVPACSPMIRQQSKLRWTWCVWYGLMVLGSGPLLIPSIRPSLPYYPYPTYPPDPPYPPIEYVLLSTSRKLSSQWDIPMLTSPPPA
ncbi:hypothetical protein BO71DRAFT_6420 [Aspergillus ellipticus CBS 707.79]|uniref:Uncharacterized protein n=1 Tax=Aspergillus ellipticus CBS 707.79 TaxID=1448320 RepID=A0A319D7I2_9EURO|nr:hypothetical protein BO71DRAFT_6420 [Aspergillus ellipticus CBS 707.79]